MSTWDKSRPSQRPPCRPHLVENPYQMDLPGCLWLGRLLSPVDISGGQLPFFCSFSGQTFFRGILQGASRVPGDSLGAPSGRESLPNGVHRVPLAGPALDSVSCRHVRSPAVVFVSLFFGTNFILAFGQAATKEAPANSQLGRPYLVRILYQMGSNCTSRSVERQIWSTTDITRTPKKLKKHKYSISPSPMGSVWPSSPRESHGEIVEIYYTTSSYSSFVT